MKRWDGFARFLDDGRICLTNNAAERALRLLCLGRKSWLFAGSDRGGARAAVMYTLIGTAKLNGVDPQAWLADVLDRIADVPQTRLHELLPWHWKAERQHRGTDRSACSGDLKSANVRRTWNQNGTYWVPRNITALIRKRKSPLSYWNNVDFLVAGVGFEPTTFRL